MTIKASRILKEMVALVGFSCAITSSFAQMPEQDCINAISLCTPSYAQTNAYSGTGDVNDVPPGSSCLSGGETNSVWYTFSVAQAGELTFQLVPVNLADDYDFALYRLTGEGCEDIASGASLPVRCNYSSTVGSTGLSAGATGTSVGSGGANQCAPLLVVAGESYALLVSNFTSSQGGYQLNLAGTATIGDQIAAAIDSVDLRRSCSPARVDLWLTDPVLCSSIASNGSDIQITGPSNVTVTAAAAISCSQGNTSKVRVILAQKITVFGTYTITIGSGSDGNTFMDACGNQTMPGTTATFVITTLGPDVSVVNIVASYCGQSSGSADGVVSGGTTPYSYHWNSTPVQTTQQATGLAPGNYTFRLTDDNGCREVVNFTVPNNTPITPNQSLVSPVSCNGLADGSAQVAPSGGQAPYNVVWQSSPPQSGLVATGLPAGSVTAVITDATGCVRSVNVNITQPPAIQTSITRVKPDCGVANGALTVAATGGAGSFTYLWNTQPPQTNPAITDLYAGVYILIITDQNGCSMTTQIDLTNNFAPDAGILSTTPDCGQSTGVATVEVTSGLPPFNFVWSTQPMQTTETASGLSSGDYYVIVTDQTGCIQIINVKVDSVPAPVLTVQVTDSDCGMDNGIAMVTVEDGIMPFSFNWNGFPLNSTDQLSALAPGTYQVSMTDAIGCTDITEFIVTQLEPVSSITANAVCLGEAMHFVVNTTSGATGWSWNFGDGSTSLEVSPMHEFSLAGPQQVTVLLSGGCMDDTVTQEVMVHPLPQAEFSFEPEIPTTRRPVQFTYTGTPVEGFLWHFGAGDPTSEPQPSFIYGVEGSYTVTLVVTDQNGCTDTAQQSLEVLINPGLFFPTAFVPDGINTIWKGTGLGIEHVEVVVYSRNGNLVWQGVGEEACIEIGWDGFFEGLPAPQGVYGYRVNSRFYNGMEWNYVGTLTLIR